MGAVIEAHGLNKRYGDTTALDDVSFSVERGRIVGLIGPNGAGKTTCLKALLGLTSFSGDLSVLGVDPRQDRAELMRRITFIADVAVLPGWLRVHEAIRFVTDVHPNFDPDKARDFLSRTKIQPAKRVKQLSKGMITQLHLALVMAIDAKLLVLDEPTLGLDILFRKQFYNNLLNDYFDGERTILVTTHQVEEIEHILTDLLFIKDGKIVLDAPMEAVQERFFEVMVSPDQAEQARALSPIDERQVFGRHVFLFDTSDRQQLAELGEIHKPGVADLFVALLQEEQAA